MLNGINDNIKNFREWEVQWMFNRKKTVFFTVFYLILFFLLTTVSSIKVLGQDEDFSETKQKLEAISDEEKEVLQNLFALLQEIQIMEKDETKISQEIELLSKEIEEIEHMISNKEIEYQSKLDSLKEVLNSYQKMGLTSYLEIILDAENLTTFLRRINILRDLARGISQLLDSLDERKKELSSEKMKLDENLILLEDRKNQLKISLDKKIQLKTEMETYLESLHEERKYYEESLSNIQKMWEELKTLFADISKVFSNIIKDGNLTADGIEMSFSIFGIKGIIKEEVFNDVIAEHPLLPEMVFTFESDKMIMYLPEENLVLKGNFLVLDNSILKFQVEEGSFYDMPLEAELTDELFEEGYLELNLKSLLGDSRLRSVEIKEGQIEIFIVPKL